MNEQSGSKQHDEQVNSNQQSQQDQPQQEQLQQGHPQQEPPTEVQYWQAASGHGAPGTQPKRSKPLLLADPRDRCMAFGMFMIAFIAADTFGLFKNPGYYGWGVTILSIVYAVSIIAYAKQKKESIPGEGCFWLAVMVICGVSYTFVYHQSLKWFHPIFLRLVALYGTIVTLRVLVNGKTGEFVLFDGLNMLFIIPFENLDTHWKIAGKEIKKMKFVSTIIKGILGLMVALPLLFIVTSLLASADAQFGDLLSTISQKMGSDFFRIIWTFVGSLPLGIYWYGLIYGSAHKRGTDTVKPDGIRKVCAACAVIPAASIYAILFAVCIIYLLFIGLQGGYYFSAVQGILPEGFTYSEYARQGFFELVSVSLINLGIIMAAQLFCGKKGILLKGFQVVLSVLTLFLIGTAITKMMLYITVYGLTPLRVIPSVFMIFLVLIFLLIIVNQFRAIPVVRVGLYAFAIGYAALSMVNMDGRIAEYNLARYQAGTLSELPVRVLIDGSLASVPAMYDVWEKTTEESLKKELSEIAGAIARDSSSVRQNSKALRYRSFEKNKAMNYIDLMTK